MKIHQFFFAEGEKDVETLEEIFEAIATCTPNGGTATGWKDFYNDDLRKCNIIKTCPHRIKICVKEYEYEK